MLLQNIVLCAALGLLFGPIDAASIQQRSMIPNPESASAAGNAYHSRTWREWARGVFYRSDRNRRLQSNKPTPNHRLSHYLHDIVLRFNVTGDDEAKALADAINTLYLDLWSATKEHVDIRIAQGSVPLLLDLLPESIRSSHAPLMHSLAETALETYPHTVQSPVPPLQVPLEQQGMKTDNLFFRNYQPWSVIVPWMKLLSSLFPSNVEVITIGKSFEGREIQGLKVGKPGASDGKRKTVVVTGAAHAREWISVSTVNYLAYSLITGYSRNDKAIDAMVENYDWIFLPTINVDGYVYTWENDRLWRKNRQPTSLAFCKGIDLDRAYPFHFDDSPQSSSNPCSDMFPGSYAFQAYESKAVADWATDYVKNGSKILGLLDLHSYSQQILYPYSYSCRDIPPDLENLEELGIGLAKAIRVRYGEHYKVTSACEGTGFANFPGTTGSGSMIDYFYARLRVPYTFQIKLRDTGSYGFLLPKESIVPTGEEIFNLLKYFSQFVSDDGSPTTAKAMPTTSDEL